MKNAIVNSYKLVFPMISKPGGAYRHDWNSSFNSLITFEPLVDHIVVNRPESKPETHLSAQLVRGCLFAAFEQNIFERSIAFGQVQLVMHYLRFNFAENRKLFG
jgi:hypothetical protein